MWIEVDWEELFVPSQAVLETLLRGSCMYLALFAMLRVFRRQTGSLSPMDLLVLLVIADAAQNGLAGEYKSITDGVLLVATIMGWEYLLDWLSFRSRWMQKVLERSPLELINEGHVQEEHLREELMTIDDLIAQLRRKGVEHPQQVKRCFLEGDGHVSVITYAHNSQAAQDEEIEPK